MASYDRRAQRIQQGRQDLPRIRAATQREEEEDIFERDAKKMFVRDNAWLAIIKRYVEKRKADGASEEFKYFTLPGKRGLDIGVLYKAGLLKRYNGHWANVAVCDKEYANIVMNRLGTFGATSQSYLEKALNRPDDPLTKFFPVDVINLDFCDAMLQDDVGTEQIIHTNLDTIQSLFRLQRGQGFLLLLTHRIGPEEYGGRVKVLLKETVEFNLRENAKFEEQFVSAFGSRNVDTCMKQLPHFGLLSVAKYIARIAQRYAYRIDEQFVGYYPRRRPTPLPPFYMGVNSFELEPIGRRAAQRYSPRFRFNNPALNDLSPRIFSQAAECYANFVAALPVRRVVDVDRVLGAANSSLRKKYTEMGDSFMEWWNEIKD